MNSDGHYLEGVEGKLPLPGTTLPDVPNESSHLDIQTFTITRVVEFDGDKSHDRGMTIEFYGSDGPLETIALDWDVATALRLALTALNKGGV